MKNDTWRHDPAQYTARYDIAPRFSDVDTLRHLNNSALQGLHAEARMRFLSERIGDAFWRERGPRLLPQRVMTDFLLESQYPQTLQAAVRVTALEAQQLVLGSALFQDGRCVGLQSTELCSVQRGQPQPLPAAWQAALDAPVPAPASDTRWSAPTQPLLAEFPQQRSMDTRYADLDATGRVSEGALMRCAEQGRSGLLREAFTALGDEAERAWLGMLVARVDLHVLQQTPAPARWQLGAGVTHLGRSSMVMRVAFFKDDAACAAYADCVLVFVNRERGVPVAMPELIRTLLDQRRVSA